MATIKMASIDDHQEIKKNNCSCGIMSLDHTKHLNGCGYRIILQGIHERANKMFSYVEDE